MKTLRAVYHRVATWNSKRYDREYNHELAMSLLREEYQEFMEAEEAVDKLDALCDLVYVAQGVIWKLDCAGEDIELAHQNAYKDSGILMQAGHIMPIYLIASVLDQVDDESAYPVLDAMCMISNLALTQMSTLVLADQVIDAMMIVCDSNDSKKIEKVSADVKANKDKGEYYVAPEPKLRKLINAKYH